jgi:XTP/dITP diphosphohydrolase
MTRKRIDHPRAVVIATRNKGKLREFEELLKPTGWKTLGLVELGIDREIEETGDSFAENARRKARGYSRETPLPVLADDSGLEVFALDRRPGIASARYAGPGASDAERIHKLLAELEGKGSGRDARFVCTLAWAQNGRILLESEGTCAGEIARAPRGTHGFGYDPIFWIPDLAKTFAELTPEEKNERSHRANAIRALLKKLPPAS